MCHTPEISAKTTVDRVAPDDQQVGDQAASPPGKPSILTVSRLGTLNKNNQIPQLNSTARSQGL